MKNLESEFQAKLIQEIKRTFPECIVLKNDPNYIQGFPDLTVLFDNGKWAVLETKRSYCSPHRPNQDYYVNKANKMSFARFVCPENMKEVIYEIQCTLRPNR